MASPSVPPEMVGASRSRKCGEFAHECGQAAGVVEMLHVMRAGWLEVEQDGNLAAQLVEGIEIDLNAGAAGYRDEVNEAVGGSADGLQDDHALRTEAAVISSLGLGAPAMAISVARLPLASAMRRRSA